MKDVIPFRRILTLFLALWFWKGFNCKFLSISQVWNFKRRLELDFNFSMFGKVLKSSKISKKSSIYGDVTILIFGPQNENQKTFSPVFRCIMNNCSEVQVWNQKKKLFQEGLELWKIILSLMQEPSQQTDHRVIIIIIFFFYKSGSILYSCQLK